MIFGIGADIVAFDRIERLHKKYGPTFAGRVSDSMRLLLRVSFAG